MDTIKNFVVNHPEANVVITILIVVIVFAIILKIIRSVVSAISACIIASLLFNMNWFGVINGAIESGEVAKYINKDNAIKVQEIYKDIKNKSSKTSVHLPGSSGKTALKYIRESR